MNSFRGAFRREVKRFISRVGCERRSEDPLALDRLRGCRAPKPSIKSAFSFHQERRPHLLDQVWIADLAPDPTGPSEALGLPAGPPEKMEIPSYTGQSVWSPLPFPLSSLRRQGRAQTAFQPTNVPDITPFMMGYNPGQSRPGCALLRGNWSLEARCFAVEVWRWQRLNQSRFAIAKLLHNRRECFRAR